MGAGKWIGGILGFMTMGPLGALAGFALGSLLDGNNGLFGNTYEKDRRKPETMTKASGIAFILHVGYGVLHHPCRRTHHAQRNGICTPILKNEFRRRGSHPRRTDFAESFEQRKQMERQNPMAFKNTIHECGAQIAANLPYEQRLQLLDFLVNIAKSDGSVCSEEIAALKEVAQCMELSPKEVESMLNLSGNSLEEAYKVLEIDPSATNEEVRTAYRRLALKHHPDRVATLGEDVKKRQKRSSNKLITLKNEFIKPEE